MDSLTQIALGAAVCEAVIGNKAGNKALLWGAIAGALPDLDVFIPYDDPIKNFTYHRSFSHSLAFLTLLTPAVVWLIMRTHPGMRRHRNRWIWAVWLSLITHPLLDCFTVYGTQLLWPFTAYPITWSTVFIVDPAYTLPLLVGTLCALTMKRSAATGHRINGVGLALSAAYLAFSVGAKMYVDRIAAASLEAQRISYTRFITAAAPLNTLLWRIVVMEKDGYYEGFYSLLDDTDAMRFTRYPSAPALLQDIEDVWAVRRLQWFTKGFYRVKEENGRVSITDLRMGQEPSYIFSFKVGQWDHERIVQTPTENNPSQRTLGSQLTWIWQRIWTETPDPLIFR